MSGGYFRVGSQFWTDPMVTRWDKDTKLIALYLLTSPHRITEGLFRQPSAYIVADTELPAAKVEKALKRMEADGFIERDGDMVRVLSEMGTGPHLQARPGISRRVRQRIIERDGLRCGICGDAVNPSDVHIDHIVPFARGGSSEMDNLQVAHGVCNMRKGDRQ